ncbi:MULTISPECIES: hypothetical protein [unclassified Streptomyces]|uniref:hypothetical protein n=1 Tax=unclassified Streptomyces TaxID=2593676 RepID=UPI00224A4BA6|nr:hypothetical protein [Streptomyces sp. NEAU-W12]MCX2927449.1 hypothetical protein [Streptomyces sp. NEAU-W12]
MRHEEHGRAPARWLMVPAGVEIDLDPPCGSARPAGRCPDEEYAARHAAVCRRCGAPQPSHGGA